MSRKQEEKINKTKKPVPVAKPAKPVSKMVKTSAKPKAKSEKHVATKKVAVVKSKVQVKAKSKPQAKGEVVKKVSKPAAKKPATITNVALGPTGVQPYQIKKNEEYMNEKQLAHFNEILVRWKEQLMAEVDRTMHNMQDEATNYPDLVDRASQEEEFSVVLRTRDRERKLLKKIEEALERIKDNDYGYCDDCGAEIGVRRLEARPTATQCIECKTIAELKERQTGEITSV